MKHLFYNGVTTAILATLLACCPTTHAAQQIDLQAQLWISSPENHYRSSLDLALKKQKLDLRFGKATLRNLQTRLQRAQRQQDATRIDWYTMEIQDHLHSQLIKKQENRAAVARIKHNVA